MLEDTILQGFRQKNKNKLLASLENISADIHRAFS